MPCNRSHTHSGKDRTNPCPKAGEALTEAGTALRVSQIIDSLFYLSAGDCCPGHRDILVLRRAHYLCPDCSDLSMVTVVQAIVQYT